MGGWTARPDGRRLLAFEGLWLFAGARTRVMAESTRRIYSAYSRAGLRITFAFRTHPGRLGTS
jgi:hypothetical protein